MHREKASLRKQMSTLVSVEVLEMKVTCIANDGLHTRKWVNCACKKRLQVVWVIPAGLQGRIH